MFLGDPELVVEEVALSPELLEERLTCKLSSIVCT